MFLHQEILITFIKFIIALYIAQSLFLFSHKKRLNFFYRISFSVFVFALILLFIPEMPYHFLIISIEYILFLIISIFLNYFCFYISIEESIFYSIAGYSVQHIAAMLTWPFQELIIFQDKNYKFFFSVIISLILYFSIYLLSYFIFAIQVKRYKKINLNKSTIYSLFLITILIEIVLNAVIVTKTNIGIDKQYHFISVITNALCSVAILIIQFNLLKQTTLKEELIVVYQMWNQDKKHFSISKETIDMINTKCHDMKHQIHNIRTSKVIEHEALKELEESILIYDSIAKTGNKALDIIFTEKSLYCQKYAIFITYIIDGKQLNFMRDNDVYSLFGNLLDNAITAVKELPIEQRTISLTIRREGDFLSINSNNYYANEITFIDGNPLTTNIDKINHGFGTKSIRLIVEKYNGTLSFDTSNYIFNVNILFSITHK